MSKHNPSRFLEFEEFCDHTGFLIREHGRDIEFFFDQARGWFDEFGNYYNCNGEPAMPSPQSEAFWRSIKSLCTSLIRQSIDDDSRSDDVSELLNEYEEEDFNTIDDEEDEEAIQTQAQIQRLLEILSHYASHVPIKVFFNGIRARCTEEQVKAFYGADGILEVVFDTRGKFKTGKGHILVRDRETAKRLVWKHRDELEGQEVILAIEALDTEYSHSDDESDTSSQLDQKQIVVPLQPQPKQTLVKKTVAIVTVRVPLKQESPTTTTTSSNKTTPQKSQPKSSYDLLFGNVPASESVRGFVEWLVKLVDETWQDIRSQVDTSKKTQQFTLTFLNKHDAETVLKYFKEHREKLMFKGRNRLTVTKGP